MNLLEAKAIVINECAREKRIVIRNVVIIAFLAVSVLVALYIYALPQLLNYTTTVGDEISKNPYQNYYRWAIVAAIVLTLLYPAISVYKVISRAKKVHEAFDKISAGENVRIITEHTRHLTTIPLYWIKLKLNPMHYVSLSIQNKAYDFPIPELLAVKLKVALSGADAERIASNWGQLYGNSELQEANEVVKLPHLSSFQQFVDKELKTDLASMEVGRKSNKNMFVIQVIIAFAFIGSIFYATTINPNAFSNSASIFTLIGVVVGGSILLSVIFILYTKFKGGSKFGDYTEFKKSIFSRVVQFVNPQFEYLEKGHIEHMHLLHSGLFLDRQYSITGGDQIFGNHNGVPFQLCNLMVTYRPNLRNEKEPDDTVFAGKYFVARFNKRFQFPVYIHPKKGIFGDFKDNEIAQYLDGGKHKITLEDPDFDKQFNVFCDDEIIARYVLTPSMMERIKEINVRSKGNFYIAINDKNIVLANNSGNASMNLEGVSGMLFTKIDEHLLNQLFEDLIADLGMIDTLKLNVNIWNK